MKRYVASCSFGKDSMATVILALEHSEPLDEVTYCEVMFDEHISGEVPEHREFIHTGSNPVFEKGRHQGQCGQGGKNLRRAISA